MATSTVQSVEQELLAIVRELLRELGSVDAAQRATLASSLDRDLGLGSLERVELLMRVERRFGKRLPDEVAQRADSLQEFLAAVEAEPSATAEQQRYAIRQPTVVAPPPPKDAASFAEVLRRFAESDPERVQIHLLEEDLGQDITYGQLYQRASDVAAGLVARGLKPGETVAIMLPTGADFFYSFFGVTLAGGIAVPIYPPARPKQIEEYVRRQLGILRNAQVRFLISWPQAKVVADVMRVGLPSLIDVTSAGELAAEGRMRPGRLPDAADTFFIQYTSGSTGNPKGVTLTHANVLANVKGIGWAVKARPDDAVVSWLPLYHDMGLIGSWLFSVYHGYPITVLSPLDFLSRPERWLWAMSDSGGTLCPAPNFSYELCVRKIEYASIEGVDLSRWRIAINAGEPVMPSTLKAFATRFETFGFRPEAWTPCYGLAESSVALTFPPANRRPVVDRIRRSEFEREGRALAAGGYPGMTLEFVANGMALPEHEVKIVDDAGKPLGERMRGRVLFRGPSRTWGYFRNPEATREAIDAEGWMDSGDLGYWANGEIFITGRLKDCIIKGGHNIIPQDVENAAAEVAGVRKGCIAAFGSVSPEAGTERLVVVAETRITDKGQRSRMRREIVAEVSRKVGVPPDVVELAPPQAVPKTSSGKIRRVEARRLFEAGELGRASGAPWLQVARLWASNLGGVMRLRLQALGRGLRRFGSGTLIGGFSLLGGALARLSPSRRVAAGIIRGCLRMAAALHGEKLRARGSLTRHRLPRVLLANRVGPGEAAAVIAGLQATTLIADERELASSPNGTGFLLSPMTIAADGDPRPSMAHALTSGFDLLIFSDTGPGEPPARSRFRLDAFQAAAAAGAEIAPVWVTGAEGFLSGKQKPRSALLQVGPAFKVNASDLASLAELRERVRDSLAELAARPG
jgi:acyl carrier protein